MLTPIAGWVFESFSGTKLQCFLQLPGAATWSMESISPDQVMRQRRRIRPNCHRWIEKSLNAGVSATGCRSTEVIPVPKCDARSAISESMSSGVAWASISTRPSGRFFPPPVSLYRFAKREVVQRKPTPWTLPENKTCCVSYWDSPTVLTLTAFSGPETGRFCRCNQNRDDHSFSGSA